MIDMHNHVLFGVDDGCQTFEESMTMIHEAINVGVTDLLMTPHYAPLRGYVASNELIQSNFNKLLEQVEKDELPIRLYLGREIDEVKGIEMLLQQQTIKTMNDTKYVLVDFGMNKTDIDEYCYELLIQGYTPIIAHPERYNYVTDFSLYHKWRKTGALIQLNASSLFHPKNKQVKKTVQYLLKQGLVDMIGSDCHRNPRNYHDYQKAIQLVLKKHKNNELKHHLLIGGETA